MPCISKNKTIYKINVYTDLFLCFNFSIKVYQCLLKLNILTLRLIVQ